MTLGSTHDETLDDRPKEECGVFGVVAPGRDVARVTFFALMAMQHRGQESAGIAVAENGQVTVLRDLGLVTDVFDENALRTLTGDMAIGHVRYSTTGANKWDNAQPVVHTRGKDLIALGHNGNLCNTASLRRDLQQGGDLSATTDSELIVAALADTEGDLLDAVRQAMPRFSGAYSVVALSSSELVAFRDPYGVRPLAIGQLPDDGWCIASETCAFDQIGATYVRDVVPGEAIRLSPDGIESVQAMPKADSKLCVFETIYFARPDSIIDNQAVWDLRHRMGQQLAIESPVDADLVVGLPDSGTPAAIGFSNESGIPFGEGVVRSRYVGRTFIQPEQQLRRNSVRRKFNPLPTILAGKRVVIVDDSIVRGTTIQQVIRMFEEAGALEVHLRISSPPVRWPCFYGIDMATRDELIAADNEVEKIRDEVGAASLAYISLDGLQTALGLPGERYCRACFTGDYPIPVPGQAMKLSFEDAPQSVVSGA